MDQPPESSRMTLPPPPPSTQAPVDTTTSVRQLTEQFHRLELSLAQERSNRQTLQEEVEQLRQPSSQASNQTPTPTLQPVELLQGIQEAVSQGMNRTPKMEPFREIHEKIRTLTSLIAAAPKFDGSGDVWLWRKRIIEYLQRRQIMDVQMRLDVIQDACYGAAQEFLATIAEIDDELDLLQQLEDRFGKDEFVRLGEYERLQQKASQSYREYADVISAKAYGLEMPLKAQLRHFLKTMRNSQQLRKFVLPQLHQYHSVKDLAAAVENLVQDDQELPRDTFQSKCRSCGKIGHFARNCPTRIKSRAAASSRPATNAQAEVAFQAEEESADWQVEYLEQEENEEDDAEYEDTEELIGCDAASPSVEPAEKRSLPIQHEEAAKRLRGPGRPLSRPVTPQMVDIPVRGQTQSVPAPALQPSGFASALRRTPPATALLPNRYKAFKVTSPNTSNRQKGLSKVMEGQVDIPVALLNGLVLGASQQPEKLAKEWIGRAKRDAFSLCQELARDANCLEIEDNLSVEVGQAAPTIINPVSAITAGQSVGYIPLTFYNAEDLTFWGLVDTGAQVSVISAGLANFLNLITEDLSNVSATPFQVSGYNGTKSYMPTITTTLRLGRYGGAEREATVQLCVLDSNEYKIILGVDILSKLHFVCNDRDKKLHLINQGRNFSLPLADRRYIQSSRSWREYHAALPSPSVTEAHLEIGVNTVADLLDDAQMAGDASLIVAEALDYVGPPLQALLRLYQKEAEQEILEEEEASDITSECSDGDKENTLPEEVPHMLLEALEISTLQFGMGSKEANSTGQATLFRAGISPRLIDGQEQLRVSESPSHHDPLSAASGHFVYPTGREVSPEIQSSSASPRVRAGQQPASGQDWSGHQTALLDPRASPCVSAGQQPVSGQDQSGSMVQVWCGPMFAGKTTKMLAEAKRLAALGKKVQYVKAPEDNRFSGYNIVSHDGATQKADQILSSLLNVDTQGVEVMAIDELHFFKNAALAVKQFKDQGIQVLATTLSTGALGEPFFIWKALEADGVEVTKHQLQANCDSCGVLGLAQYSARTIPVESSWVGSKEAYCTCCEQCFHKQSVFHNPTLLLHDPEYYRDNERAILATIGLTEAEFCAAVAAIVVTFQNGQASHLCVEICPACHHPHVDEFRFAMNPHHTHVCQKKDCNETWAGEQRGISNPIILLSPTLQEGKLRIQVPPVQVGAVLPTSTQHGMNLGTAQLPCVAQDRTLQGEKLSSFLKQHELTPSGDPATLPARAWKLREIIEGNHHLISPDLGAQQKQELLQMLLDVAEVFCTAIEDLKVPAKGEAFEIITGEAKPIKQKPYRLGEPEQKFLDKTIASQMAGGIITPSRSPWSSPAFVTYYRPYNTTLAPKPRKVTDYRRLNAITETDTYPLPDIPQTLEWLAQYEFIGAVDLKSGYWQKEVRPEDRKKTAFVTPRSLLEYCRVPFGLKNAPSYFQREINKMISTEALHHSKGFIDDLMTGGHQWDTYLTNQRELFEACKQYGWLITPSKVRLGYTAVNVLGHRVSKDSIHPDPSKIQAIRNLQAPLDIRSLRALLGLMGYYRRFITDYARTAKPLTNLLQKDSPFLWGREQEEAMDKLKQKLCNAVALTRPQPNGRFVMYTDWSKDALGACLHQKQEDGVERPIAFASRLTRGPEGNLASSEGELAAFVYGLGKFRSYLGFAEFDAYTDSAALKTLKTNQNLSGKLARWSLLLSEFNFVLHHKAGKKHKNADGLTRSHQADNAEEEPYIQVWESIQSPDFLTPDLPDLSAPPPSNIKLATRELNMVRQQEIRGEQCGHCGEPIHNTSLTRCGRCGQPRHLKCTTKRLAPYWYCESCSRTIAEWGPADISEDLPLQDFIQGGPTPDLLSEDEAKTARANYLVRRNQLLIDTPEGFKVFPTPYERDLIAERFHHSLQHLGTKRTAEAVAESHYWPGLEADVKRVCASCLPCQLQTAVFRRRDEVGGHLASKAPRIAWSMDCAPGLNTSTGRQSILVIVDDFSKLVVLVLMPKLDSASIRQAFLQHILAVYGRPKQVRTDQGKEFQGHFASLLRELSITHVLTRPVAPWTNGRAERMVRTVKSCLKRVLAANPKVEWPQILPWLQAAINTTVSRTTGYSPHEILFGEPPSPLIPSVHLPPVPADLAAQPVEEYVKVLRRRLADIHRRAAQVQEEARRQAEQDYRNTPIAGRQYGGEQQMALKSKFTPLNPGQLVAIKAPKSQHFDLGAAGPRIVLEDLGDSARVQAMNGRIQVHNKANIIKLNAFYT